VAIAGVSGSGKPSPALGVLYAEGSRRYLVFEFGTGRFG
jgi:excinuclease UvrABC ATPase subunit